MYDKSGNLIDRREMLRVKIKSLMAEAAFIRAEETRLKYRRKASEYRREDDGTPAMLSIRRPIPCPQLFNELHSHRVKELRKTARATHIALGFIRLRTLPQIEPRVVNLLWAHEWDAIDKMVFKYGSAEAHLHCRAQRELYRDKQYSPPKPVVQRTKQSNPETEPNPRLTA